MHELLKGYGTVLVYFITSVALALLARPLLKFSREVFRKTLHLIVLGSVFVWTYGFVTWWIAVSSILLFVLMVFPILRFGERFEGYSEFLVERKTGEIKRSLIAMCVMLAVLITVCWGLLGQRYLVIASVAAWGLGDATAALVGKRYGKRYIEGRLVEGRKSVEGTVAMFVVSFFSVLLILLVNGSLKWHGYIPIAFVTAAVTTVVELYTKSGMDTITCPLAAASILIPLVYLWGV